MTNRTDEKRLQDLQQLVEDEVPDLVKTVVEDGQVVLVKAETFSMTRNTTYLLGAMMQVLRRRGAYILVLPVKAMKQLSSDSMRSQKSS